MIVVTETDINEGTIALLEQDSCATVCTNIDETEEQIIIKPNKSTFLRDKYLKNRHKLKYKTQYKR